MHRQFRALLLLSTAGLLMACGPSRKELQAELDKVSAQLTQSQQENETLRGKITALEADVADRDARIAELERELGDASAQLDELRDEQNRRKAELQTYKDLFARLQKLIDAGTIKVSFRKGRMIVELASAVLFDSGKTELKDAGKTALDELVVAFQSVSDRDLMIAGHTDNVPIKTRRFKSNWELSTARAVVVVNYMIEKGFPAQHLGAAGFGDQDPVASNDTEDERALNRRIEIVLMPNLGELAGLEEMINKSNAKR
ncbi:MAG: OmpA family protein [Myxococcales bacterium]|nr:OmpA family protein [Myxococcales bacterium]